MKKETQQLVIMLLIGVALGAIGANLWSKRNVQSMSINESSTASSSDSEISGVKLAVSPNPTVGVSQMVKMPLAADIPANSRVGLEVRDQKAGSSVIVGNLELKEPHWMAVYDERDGMPGWILGAKRLVAGDTGGEVTLLRATVAGERYFVIMHNDDGNLEFNKLTDSVPDDMSKMVAVSFKAE